MCFFGVIKAEADDSEKRNDRMHDIKPHSHDDDLRMAADIREDAEKGFRVLLKRYKEMIYWHIRRIVASHEDAQDATQETFVRVFRNIRQYAGDSSLKTWIFRIATNEALRLCERRTHNDTLPIDGVQDEGVGTKPDAFFDNTDEVVARLQKAIKRLPRKQQLAFNMRYYDDMSYREIAEVTGMTEASVKANYHVAKEKIKVFMTSNQV